MSKQATPTNAAILLTPRAGSAGSAIAVLRLHGPEVREFLRRFFSKPARAGRCVHGELRDGEQVIDDPVVVLGEKGLWADLNVHGGAWVINAVLDLARREGFEVIESSLPLADVAMNEVPSLMEREMLAHLPLARTELAIRALLEQPAAWSEMLAKREAMDVAAMLGDRSLWWLLHPPRVAIVGEPNVGKSTLANRLFGQTRSITADVPGTTRDWVEEPANLEGLAIHLVDTPGQRKSDDALEEAAIAASREKIEQSDLRICVLDATCRPGKIERAELLVMNKIDCERGWDFKSLGAIEISAKTGRGIDELIRQIRARFGLHGPWKAGAKWWTQRQREILSQSLKNGPAYAADLAEKILTQFRP